MAHIDEVLRRMRDAAGGFPNPGVNDTVIVRRGDLRALLLDILPATPITDRDRLAFVKGLLGAYRRKRAVDGLNKREWDAQAHWKAEQEIDQLERDWFARETGERWSDAETPP